MEQSTGGAYLAETVRILGQYKGLADRAVAQAGPQELFRSLDADSNSIAILMQHLAGNMRSRWTDFLTTDGEKPDRNRDAEFEIEAGTTPDQVLARWEDGWRRTFAALQALGPGDLLRTVTIGGKPCTVLEAIERAVGHYVYHVGQIVFLAKHTRGPAWEALSVPKRRRGSPP
ncbi:MAG TPA: DUF1572 family protein [Gemmatimonadales bacterium]